MEEPRGEEGAADHERSRSQRQILTLNGKRPVRRASLFYDRFPARLRVKADFESFHPLLCSERKLTLVPIANPHHFGSASPAACISLIFFAIVLCFLRTRRRLFLSS